MLPLFGQEAEYLDPMRELLLEAMTDVVTEKAAFRAPKTTERLLVSESQFPDQSMYVLCEQLKALRERLERIKFYLGDLDDLLPR